MNSVIIVSISITLLFVGVLGVVFVLRRRQRVAAQEYIWISSSDTGVLHIIDLVVSVNDVYYAGDADDADDTEDLT